MKPTLLCGAMLAMALTATSSIAAEPPTPPTPPTQERAAALEEQAKQAALAGRHEEALKMLHEAWAIHPSRGTACNIGRVAFHHGVMRDAAEFLSICTQTTCSTITPPVETPADRDRLTRSFDDLGKARAEVVALTIEVSDPRAVVLVDGEAVEQTPSCRVVYVEPGAHVIEAKLAGHVTATARINGAKGESLKVPLKLEPRPSPQAAEKAPPPGGLPRAAGPRAEAPMAEAPWNAPWNVHLPAAFQSPIALGVGGGGATLFVVAGVALASGSRAAFHDAEDHAALHQYQSGPCASFECGADDALATRDGLRTAATASLVLGGALGVATIALALLRPKRAGGDARAHHVDRAGGAGGARPLAAVAVW